MGAGAPARAQPQLERMTRRHGARGKSRGEKRIARPPAEGRVVPSRATRPGPQAAGHRPQPRRESRRLASGGARARCSCAAVFVTPGDPQATPANPGPTGAHTPAAGLQEAAQGQPQPQPDTWTPAATLEPPGGPRRGRTPQPHTWTTSPRAASLDASTRPKGCDTGCDTGRRKKGLCLRRDRVCSLGQRGERGGRSRRPRGQVIFDIVKIPHPEGFPRRHRENRKRDGKRSTSRET
jgi:hypothetical protein